MEEYVDIFKALSDQTRIKILWLLLKSDQNLCVCELVDAIGENQYNVSKHLKILKHCKLVKSFKKGRWVFYSIVKSENNFYHFIFKAILSMPQKFFENYEKNLEERLKLRKNGVPYNCPTKI